MAATKTQIALENVRNIGIMAGRMGGKRVTQVGLTVHEIDPERNLLLVKGAVPGPKNGFVEVREDRNRGGS